MYNVTQKDTENGSRFVLQKKCMLFFWKDVFEAETFDDIVSEFKSLMST